MNLDSKIEDFFYKKLYKKILRDINESLVCSISFEKIKIPTICPSAHVMEKGILKRLVREDRKDPFNNVDYCVKVIINRFAVRVQ